MVQSLIETLGIAHGIAAAIAAVTYFAVWKRSRFWLPRYVHFLAAVGLLIGFGIVATTSPDAPVARWGIAGQLFALLVCPALVYLFFVFYGGQAAALDSRDRVKREEAP